MFMTLEIWFKKIIFQIDTLLEKNWAQKSYIEILLQWKV